MKDLQDEFENKLLKLSNEYSGKGLEIHEQISIFGYLCIELCNRVFMDARFGYGHFLTILIQRMIYDISHEEKRDEKIRKKNLLH